MEQLTRCLKFSNAGVEEAPSLSDCVPVHVLVFPDFYALESPALPFCCPTTPQVKWSDGLLTSVRSFIPLYLLRSKLILGVGIYLVSDASKKHGKGAYAWVIALDEDILCQNSGLVYAEAKSMTSYRAEAFGVLSLVVFLRRLFESQDCSFRSHLKIHCDNISVVNTAGEYFDITVDADVFLQLRQEVDAMKDFLTLEFVHVKGHQTITPFSSREAVLNHLCDGRAKSVVARTPIGHCQQHFHFPAAKIVISSGGTIGRSLKPWLRQAVDCTDLLQYLQGKFDWDATATKYIDWPAYETAHRRLPRCHQTTMVKYCSRWLATRAQLHLLKDSPTPVCPLCGVADETVDHILTCSCQADQRRKFYRRLEQWFQHFNVPLKLQLLLVTSLKLALGDSVSAVPSVSSASASLKKFVAEQDSIGWGNLLCGFVSSQLATYMDQNLPEQANCNGQEWSI